MKETDKFAFFFSFPPHYKIISTLDEVPGEVAEPLSPEDESFSIFLSHASHHEVGIILVSL